MAEQDVYAPTREDRFAFGLWSLLGRGRDSLGDPTRADLPVHAALEALAQRDVFGFEFQDTDLVAPIERDEDPLAEEELPPSIAAA